MTKMKTTKKSKGFLTLEQNLANTIEPYSRTKRATSNPRGMTNKMRKLDNNMIGPLSKNNLNL